MLQPDAGSLLQRNSRDNELKYCKKIKRSR